MAVAAFEIEEVDLVERILRLAFALEDERLAVRREITFATAFALEDELACVGDELRFGRGGWHGAHRGHGPEHDGRKEKTNAADTF